MPEGDQPAPRPASETQPALTRAVISGLDRLLAKPLAPGLYVVATPIGHLADISLRALSVLATAERIYCEDTRQSRKLLDAYGLTTSLTPYHDHNGEVVRPRIIEALARGERVALISDAGTPLVSDPGYKLVRAVREAGHAVHAVPGASALLAALASAGLPTDQFQFAGFLPPRQQARRTRLAELLTFRATLVLFEAPGRVADLLMDVGAVGGAARVVAVARELTKLHEEIVTGTAAELAARLAERPLRGECVVLIAPAEPDAAADVDPAALEAALEAALTRLPPSAAAKQVAAQFGLPKSDVYARATALKTAAQDPRGQKP